MDNLKNKLIEYKNLTLNIIDSLDKDDYDSPEELLNKRENIIRDINSISYEKIEFKFVAEELGLMELEQKLTNTMVNKKRELKTRLNKVSETKQANTSYNIKGFYSHSINKKI